MPPAERSDPTSQPETCAPERDLLIQADILDRLKRIEGQVRGIQKMIQERRSCNDIIIQLAAVKAAITRVSLTVLNCHLAESIMKDLQEGRDFKDSLAESMAIFKKFS
jgi:DNA-binding FrmR family transcriptional regulator